VRDERTTYRLRNDGCQRQVPGAASVAASEAEVPTRENGHDDEADPSGDL